MSVYDLRIKRFALLLLPIRWRKPLIAAWVQSSVQAINVLYGQFMQWRANIEYRLEHNGQVCYLRSVLNDLFDPIERRITITDEVEEQADQTWYQRHTETTRLLPMRETRRPLIIERRGFGGINGFDFWINIPLSLYATIELSRLRAIVSTYKLASKRFSINYTEG